MVEIQNKTFSYVVQLETGENIKILINDNEAFNETVSPSKQGRVKFTFSESIFE